MAITVCGNCIDFGSQSICVDPGGIYVSGRFEFECCSILNPFQGSVSGYTSGGFSPGNQSTTIDKFPFASCGASTDVGELTTCLFHGGGNHSSTCGIIFGGSGEPSVSGNIIQAFPFSSDSPASCVGSLIPGSSGGYVGSAQSVTHAYSSGGASPTPAGPKDNRIQKFAFTSSSAAVCVGTLVDDTESSRGATSGENGYHFGAETAPTSPVACVINRYPFATDSPATNVGDATFLSRGHGSSSKENAYHGVGNALFAPGTAGLQKMPFANDTTTSSIGALSPTARCSSTHAAQASQTHGFFSGGFEPGQIQEVQNFPFSSDTSATCVGCLTLARYAGAGASS